MQSFSWTFERLRSEKLRFVGVTFTAEQSKGNIGLKNGVDRTKPLPANAGRLVAVLLDILKYDVDGDVAAGRASIAA